MGAEGWDEYKTPCCSSLFVPHTFALLCMLLFCYTTIFACHYFARCLLPLLVQLPDDTSDVSSTRYVSSATRYVSSTNHDELLELVCILLQLVCININNYVEDQIHWGQCVLYG